MRTLSPDPQTLIALLRAAAYGWRQESLAENAQKISELGRVLYERVQTMSEHFGRVGSSLKGAVENYNKAVGSLEQQILPAARRFEELGLRVGITSSLTNLGLGAYADWAICEVGSSVR